MRAIVLLFAVFVAVAVGCSSARVSPRGKPVPPPAKAEATAPVDLLGLPPLGVRSKANWEATRRDEIRGLFEHHVYGRVPPGLGEPAFEVLHTEPKALDGVATRVRVRVTLPAVPKWDGFELMVHVPNGADWPVPCVVGLNFRGNHTLVDDPAVPIPDGNEHARGHRVARWPLALAMQRGIAVATAWYEDIEPDRPDGFRVGLRGAASPRGAATEWRPGQWGAIAAWAQGLRLIADYLEREVTVDAKRLAVLGHSRLGKTALWAGALDPRFDVVVSNNSGEGGAALMRRPVGETTAAITSRFPHWFTPTYRRYANDPTTCPVDQHMLIALSAPRAVYVGSASRDTWADPEGEFLACVHAAPAWEAYGLEALGVQAWPAANTPVGDHVGYHVRVGSHNITACTR